MAAGLDADGHRGLLVLTSTSPSLFAISLNSVASGGSPDCRSTSWSPVTDGSLIGRNLDGRYRLLEVIGEGGMGQVFRAEQLATKRTVALKLLHSQLTGVAEIVQRFEREARVTTELAHPHIVKTVEFGQ